MKGLIPDKSSISMKDKHNTNFPQVMTNTEGDCRYVTQQLWLTLLEHSGNYYTGVRVPWGYIPITGAEIQATPGYIAITIAM